MPYELIWRLKNVRHVPYLKRSLVSMSQLANLAHVASFIGDTRKVTKGAMVIARGNIEGTLYVINRRANSIGVADSDVDGGFWHQRFGHMDKKDMHSLLIREKLHG
ncbi:Retrovirus-related Pol polyprotein from transposon TNT 1-94 [Dendrobium catenatum]|uniref:Retrovirus-related Pol polyprotein from transposon TNT 1-94 n=1 Tax=Dendrobium catenatum TaxID=906689 RepID=A0A2I0VFW5_9ASPA|nr:Retrovirus-related Pol polyprotein from transposon TNT 1-94 [Dendrobium catenatum]